MRTSNIVERTFAVAFAFVAGTAIVSFVGGRLSRPSAPKECADTMTLHQSTLSSTECEPPSRMSITPAEGYPGTYLVRCTCPLSPAPEAGADR